MTDKQIVTITDRIMKAAQKDRREIVEDLVEKLLDSGRADGMRDLLIDLWDAKEIGEDGVEFAVENNGAADPRR